jgi:hypothetical protein
VFREVEQQIKHARLQREHLAAHAQFAGTGINLKPGKTVNHERNEEKVRN